jgi:hypothetical protein
LYHFRSPEYIPLLFSDIYTSPQLLSLISHYTFQHWLVEAAALGVGWAVAAAPKVGCGAAEEAATCPVDVP